MRAILSFAFVFALGCHTTGLGPNNGDLGDHVNIDFASTDFGDCSSFTDEQSCTANGCVAHVCPTCGSSVFEGCYAPGIPIIECQTPSCPNDCSSLTTAATCNAEPGCFSLFGAGACACATAGCCPMLFLSCAQGPAMCTAGPTAQQPNCPALPACGPGYTFAYGTDDCPLGCVETSVCAP